jgi:hypothetical protein
MKLTGAGGFLVLVMVAADLGGCSDVVKLRAASGMDELKKSPVARAIATPTNATPLTVAVQVTPSVGCLLRKNPTKAEEETAPTVCEFLAIAGDGDPQAMLRAKTPSDLGADMFVFVDDAGQTITASLREHLAARFKNVSVTETQVPAAGITVATTAHYAQAYSRFGMKHTYLTLTAKLPQGGELIGHGEGAVELGSGKLAWAIPVAVVFFPIGSFTVLAIIISQEHDAMALSFAQAIDNAARELADKLAAMPVSQAELPLNVEVALALAPQ